MSHDKQGKMLALIYLESRAQGGAKGPIATRLLEGFSVKEKKNWLNALPPLPPRWNPLLEVVN